MSTCSLPPPIAVRRAQSSENNSLRSARSVLSETVLPNSIEYHLHEPISAGFLLKFCDVHYCSENMRFITAVDRFRDYFHRDRSAWPAATWRQLDVELGVLQSEGEAAAAQRETQEEFARRLRERDFVAAQTWPSQVVNREAVRECLQEIWELYLAENAKYWICMPSAVLAHTMRRVQLVHVYGPDVFAETLLDPIKTIQRDIYPRFLLSEEYRVMKRYQAALEPLPCSSKLRLPRPRGSVYSRYKERDIERGNVSFTLEDLLEDRVLYGEFSRFLQQIVALENLYCVRAIAVFRECLSSREKHEQALAFDIAWTIYKFFVASSSAFEISLAYQVKKEIMRELASPSRNTFNAVELSALEQLKIHYARYTQTKEFAQLHKVVGRHKHSAVQPSTMTSHNVYAQGESSVRSVVSVWSLGSVGEKDRERDRERLPPAVQEVDNAEGETGRDREIAMASRALPAPRTSCFPLIFSK